MKKYKIISSETSIPTYIIGGVDKTEKIGGVLIELLNVKKIYNFYFFKVLLKGQATYYWKPLASIFDRETKEIFSRNWYRLLYPIIDYKKDILSSRVEIKEIYSNSKQEKFLLLNNILKNQNYGY